MLFRNVRIQSSLLLHAEQWQPTQTRLYQNLLTLSPRYNDKLRRASQTTQRVAT